MLDIKESPHGIRIRNIEFIWGHNSKENFFSNSILIHDENTHLVDPSANFSYLEHIASQKIVKYVLNTHYHADHRSLNSLFKHAKFLCHKLDEPALVNFDNYLTCANTGESFYKEWLKMIFASLDIMEGHISLNVKDEDFLDLKDSRVQVVHLPGHTPGHIGLHFVDLHLLFTADIDLTPTGPWYANLGSDIDQFQDSLKKVKLLPCEHFITSHGSRIYDREKFILKVERFENAIEKRDLMILDLLKDKPRDLDELSLEGIIYKQSQLQNPLKASFNRQMIEKHLERMNKNHIASLNEEQKWELL